MTYATSDDVAVRWGQTPSTEQTATIDTLLSDVERLILKRIPDLSDKISAGTIDEADVVQVEAQAVIRVMRNPDGYVSETDGTYTYQYAAGAAAGVLQVLPDEWELLGVGTGGGMTVVVPRPIVPAPFFPEHFDSNWWY